MFSLVSPTCIFVLLCDSSICRCTSVTWDDGVSEMPRVGGFSGTLHNSVVPCSNVKSN